MDETLYDKFPVYWKKIDDDHLVYDENGKQIFFYSPKISASDLQKSTDRGYVFIKKIKQLWKKYLHQF